MWKAWRIRQAKKFFQIRIESGKTVSRSINGSVSVLFPLHLAAFFLAKIIKLVGPVTKSLAYLAKDSSSSKTLDVKKMFCLLIISVLHKKIESF